ncbi:tetratricopeptide repeat protein [Micromonosporaceae bacterium DT55]|uniref:tetratricopeptide repeat protein n=1 Tax=Melissospora conviva TaxID=3388432 RepID=UPI003C1EE015
MTATDDLRRMLHEVESMPYGAGQMAAAEQLIRRADAAGEGEEAFAARMLATQAYVYGGEPAKSFVTFSWCLADFDRNPQPYHKRFAHTLLWHFKYMVHALLNFPEVPLERAYGVLDDMERRYRDAGHSLQAVYKMRHRVARHIGDDDAARKWYELWITTPRDDLSDCAGCDPSAQAGYLADLGRDEEAIALAEPVLAGRLTCVEQPQAMLTALLLPYLRTGRGDAAREAHRTAYRRVRANLADLGDIGEHVDFCARTGNEARGLEIVERHLDWLDRAPSPAAAMQFAEGAGLLLRRLTAAGRGDLTLHRRAGADRPAGEVTVAALADELSDLATGLAARFDARNGTSAQSERVAAQLSAEPIGEHLPLSASLRAPRPQEVAPVVAQPAAPVPIPADAGPQELLDLAEEQWRTERRDDLQRVLDAFDARYPESELTGVLRARRTELRAAELSWDGRMAEAMAANRAAVAGYRQAGDPVREAVVNSRIGLMLCLTGEAEEGLALTRQAAGFLADHGSDAVRAGAYDRLAMSRYEQHDRTGALAELDRAQAAAEAAGEIHLRTRIALHRAQVLEEMDRPAEFAEAARVALELSREAGVEDYLVAAALACARTADEASVAVALADEAVRTASGANLLPARLLRGRALVADGRAGEAVADFVEVVALCVERDDHEGAAFLRWELADVYRQAGRFAEAAEVAEEAVLLLDGQGRQYEADQCRHLLSQIYLALDEEQPALTLLEQLAANYDSPDNLPMRAQVLEEAGAVLYDRDRDGLAAGRFTAAAEAYRLADLPVDELRARRRAALALLWSGDPAVATSAIDRADVIVAALDGELAQEPAVVWEVAMLADAAARVLVEAERPQEALVRLAGVADRLRGIEAFGEALQVEMLVGELLLRSDRAGEAEPLLRSVLGALPTSSAAVPRTAWMLSRALAESGREAEAEELRQRYGLTEEG